MLIGRLSVTDEWVVFRNPATALIPTSSVDFKAPPPPFQRTFFSKPSGFVQLLLLSSSAFVVKKQTLKTDLQV